MPMNQKKRDLSVSIPRTPIGKNLTALEQCMCLPLSPQYEKAIGEKLDPESEEMVPTSSTLNSQLRTTLQTLFPRSTPLSIFLLHTSQWERTLFSQEPELPYQRHHYHASPDLLEQVMTNVRRVMRADDQVLLQEHAGAIIIFPDVDQQGAYTILERIYHSICLLQAETLIPPLTLNTTILMSMSTYPEPATSVEQLLYFTGLPAHRLTLRPAITIQHWNASSTRIQETISKDGHVYTSTGQPGFPFMNLPSTIPLRLQHLIPYTLATELRCAPVGRDHHCLTVAMADPTNSEHVQRLQHATGLTVFPVSCNLAELSILLTKPW